MMKEQKQTETKLKNMRKELKRMGIEKHQRLINELVLEGMKDTDIAHEVRVASMTVYTWRTGKSEPRAEKAELIERLHKQVMYLKRYGIKFSDVGDKTITQVYDEKRLEEKAAS